MIRRLCALALLLALPACGGMAIEDFEGTEPRFVPEEYLLGQTRVFGLFQDRFGTVRRQFVADIEGRMEDGVLILDEDFRYADGTTDERTWRFEKVGDDRYEGTAGDVVGTATGIVRGQAFHLEYDLELEVGDDVWRVHFDDWLLLQPNGVVINRATVSKFGITVGELSAFFVKPEQG